MKKILVVEDGDNLVVQMEKFLMEEGFQPIMAETLSAAKMKLKENPDLILLDWMLPDGQGIQQLKEWRSAGVSIPIIMVTARTELVDKLLGLELGSNDFITKPFEPRELVARIRVQLRMAENFQKIKPEILDIGGIEMDLKSMEVTYQNQKMELTKTEYQLLKIFLENPNQVFSREELLQKVWGYHQSPTTRTVDTHILQLRQKTSSDYFETVHGIGYRFRPKII